jgi:hypothetical protein
LIVCGDAVFTNTLKLSIIFGEGLLQIDSLLFWVKATGEAKLKSVTAIAERI